MFKHLIEVGYVFTNFLNIWLLVIKFWYFMRHEFLQADDLMQVMWRIQA